MSINVGNNNTWQTHSKVVLIMIFINQYRNCVIFKKMVNDVQNVSNGKISSIF